MTGEAQDNAGPLPRFYFSVELGDGAAASFQEVEGLDREPQGTEYRHGNSPVFYPIKMPGLGRVGNVTMRRGLFVNGPELRRLVDETKLGTAAPRTMMVHLLDENGARKLTWTLNDARPIKITGPDLKGDGNEVAVESVEIAYETLTETAS
jgi:phage tail-like protein